METSKIFDTIGRNIDELVIDLLLPARAERKVYRKAFDRFYQQLDQLILTLGNDRQMPRKLSGLLILIYVDLVSNIRKRNQESPISNEVKNYENYLNQIFEDPSAKERTKKEPILFYRIRDEYGCFSNFAPYGFEEEGKWWKTSEHYFQAKKFEGTPYEEEVRIQDSPMEAANIGRNRALPLREDWEEVKDEIMRKAVQMKFAQNPEIQQQLLETGERELIEKTTSDHYWGCGTSGEGKNMLGNILMQTRKELLERMKKTENSFFFDEMKNRLEALEPKIAESVICRQMPPETQEELFFCLEEIKKEVRGKEMIPREIAGVVFRLYTEICHSLNRDDYEDPILYLSGKFSDSLTKILGSEERWDKSTAN